MRELPLSRGGVTVVDDDVYEWASLHKWQMCPCSSRRGDKWYARRTVWFPDRTSYQQSLARSILGLGRGDPRMADHIDGDSLNNLRENLRVVTHSQNARNRGACQSNTTGYRGVIKRDGVFRAIIAHDKRRFDIGAYTTSHEAAWAINVASQLLDADHFRLNVIPEGESPSPERAEEIRIKVELVVSHGLLLVIRRDSSTGYRGVTVDPRLQRPFVARICARDGHSKRFTRLGIYGNPHEAAVAYNVAKSILMPNLADNPIPDGEVTEIRQSEIREDVIRKLALRKAV